MNEIIKFKVLSTILLTFYLFNRFGYSYCGPNRPLTRKLLNIPIGYHESSEEIESKEKLFNDRHNFDALQQKFQTGLLKSVDSKINDFVVILDDFETIGQKNFSTFLRFLKSFGEVFDVSYNGTRITIISFGPKEQMTPNAVHVSNPSTYKSRDKPFAEQLFQLPFTQFFGHRTSLYSALKTAKEVLKYSRRRAPKVIILISARYSDRGDGPRLMARTLASSGVNIFTLSIGNESAYGLEQLSSVPIDDHHFVLNTFDDIETLLEKFKFRATDSCDQLCKEYSDCCDINAKCVCNASTGTQSCVCRPGYDGSGMKGDCSLVTCPETQHPVLNKLLNRIECECKKGYIQIGDKCEVVKCPELVAPDNGFFSVECNSVYNAACGIICKPGYQLRGTSIRICNEKGIWDGLHTYCLVRKCPELKAPANGSIDCSTHDFRFDTVCRFGCDLGFQVQGSRERTCLAIAMWDGLPVTCIPIPSHY